MGDLGAGSLEARYAPSREAAADWDWPAYDFLIPPNWPSGAYLAVVSGASDADPGEASPHKSEAPRAYAERGQALFVVKNRDLAARASILYKLPLFTYHAYTLGDVAFAEGKRAALGSWQDGQCLYTGGVAVSLRRPGGGTGGRPWDAINLDEYDKTTPRQTFAHWDAPFIAWLARNGFEVDFCTDWDLHRQSAQLQSYALLLSAGHDEYWSDAMRAAAQGFVRVGGNIAFFGGNTAYFRVTLDADDMLVSRAGSWTTKGRGSTAMRQRENALTGVSYNNGGGKWKGGRPATGYRVQHADHWVYEGTGLRDGDIFGAEPRLIGYECDGAAFNRVKFTRSGYAQPTHKDGTPRSFEILGVGDIKAWDVSEGGEVLGNAAATMGTYTQGGTVFTAATVDWPRIVAFELDASTVQITRNVLTRLSRRAHDEDLARNALPNVDRPERTGAAVQ